MTKTLNGGSDDYYLSNILSAYGKKVVADLFPDYQFRASPVITEDTPWDFDPVLLPEAEGETTRETRTIPGLKPEGRGPGTGKIGRAHVGPPLTNAHNVCRRLLEEKNL